LCRLDGGPGPPELGDDDLERPRIYSDHITDAGVAHLSRLANLTLLTLASKNVSDDTLIHLKVSAEGIERLQQARPDLKIVRDQVR